MASSKAVEKWSAAALISGQRHADMQLGQADCASSSQEAYNGNRLPKYRKTVKARGGL